VTIKVDVVGIGPGDPDQVTVQAVKALQAADRFLLVTKRRETQELVDIRAEILDRHVGGDWRSQAIFVQDAERGRSDDAAEQSEAVARWRAERARRFASALQDVPAGARVAVLAWGDPALYDSTLGVLEDVRANGGPALEIRVVPGISSIQALAAGHRIGLNRVGGAVELTTGRRLRAGLPQEADDVVVLLDGSCAFRDVDEEGVELFWGAYLGTPDELLVAGPLEETAEEVLRVRAEAKERKGWMFDTYLLRRRADRPR
jgi:precorrin-6A synthase